MDADHDQPRDFWDATFDMLRRDLHVEYPFAESEVFDVSLRRLCDEFRERSRAAGCDVKVAPSNRAILVRFGEMLDIVVKYHLGWSAVNQWHVCDTSVRVMQVFYADLFNVLFTGVDSDPTCCLLMRLLPVSADPGEREAERNVAIASMLIARSAAGTLSDEQRARNVEVIADLLARFVDFSRRLWRHVGRPFRTLMFDHEVAEIGKIYLDWSYHWGVPVDEARVGHIVHFNHMMFREHAIDVPMDAPLPPPEERMSNRLGVRHLEEFTRYLAAKSSAVPDDGRAMPADEPVVDVSEAAARLGVDRSSVTRGCASGRFPGARKDADGSWKIPESAVPQRPAPGKRNCSERKRPEPIARVWTCASCDHQVTSVTRPLRCTCPRASYVRQ